MHTSEQSKGRFIWGVVFAFLVGLSGVWYYTLSPWAGTQESQEQEAEIVVGYLPIYVDLPLFVAVEEGLFEQRGLNVRLERFGSSPDMAAALVSGQINAVASIATPTALVTEDRDAGLFEIFMVDQATIDAPLSSLMLPEGSTVTSISDLAGKTVGAFPGPTTTTLSPLAFQVDGLETSQFRLIDVPPSNHLELLNSGTIDALVTYEPTATQAEMKNGATRLVRGFIETKLMNPWPAGSWLLSSDILDTPAERQMAKGFAEAIYEATDMLRSNPDEMKLHLAPYTLIDQDVAKQSPNIAFTKSSEADAASLQGYADLLFEQGVINRRPTTNDLLVSF